MSNALQNNSSIKSTLFQQQWSVYKRQIHVYETDKDGVVHFSNYLRIAEEAIFSGFRKIGFPVENNGQSMVMLNIDVRYVSPIRFGDIAEVSLVSIKAKRVKLFLELDIHCNGNLTTQVKLVFASIRVDGNKVIPLSMDLRSAVSNKHCSVINI